MVPSTQYARLCFGTPGPLLIRATGRITGGVRAGISRWIIGRWFVLVARWLVVWILNPSRRSTGWWRHREAGALPPDDGGWILGPWRHQILPLTTPVPTWGCPCGHGQQLGQWQHYKGGESGDAVPRFGDAGEPSRTTACCPPSTGDENRARGITGFSPPPLQSLYV